jgi:MiaB-like tRNA modifying enzyme
MKFYFESYGCTMNQGEAKLMEVLLSKSGHSIVEDIEESDALVLVTCTVIETTERKMLKRLAAFSETQKPVIVGGCMTTAQKDLILSSNPDAMLVVPDMIHDIGNVVKGFDVEFKREIINQEVNGLLDSVQPDTVDTIIPIASGCLGRCSYCITKLARGDLKSNPPDGLMEDIEKKLAEGYKEIRLSSQDNAAYGRDIGEDLPELIRKITGLSGEFRVRVGMMNPDNALPIMKELISVYRYPKVYKFLHVPFQSGSERILGIMNRQYTIDDFFKVIDGFREAFPDITISTDVIVGFPGEQDEDFEKSVKLVEKLKPDILNITRFSARPGTPAMEMKNKIHSRIAKDRSRALTALHTEISSKINKRYVGQQARILVTEQGTNNTMMGRMDNYKTVVLEENVSIGQFMDVEIIDSSPVYLKGKIV